MSNTQVSKVDDAIALFMKLSNAEKQLFMKDEDVRLYVDVEGMTLVDTVECSGCYHRIGLYSDIGICVECNECGDCAEKNDWKCSCTKQ